MREGEGEGGKCCARGSVLVSALYCFFVELTDTSWNARFENKQQNIYNDYIIYIFNFVSKYFILLQL